MAHHGLIPWSIEPTLLYMPRLVLLWWWYMLRRRPIVTITYIRRPKSHKREEEADRKIRIEIKDDIGH